MDFEVERFTKRCAESGQALGPGAGYVSALVTDGAAVVRKDYSQAAWNGPPAGTMGWWRGVVPDPEKPRWQWAPNDALLHLFQQLEDDRVNRDLRYVMALLMVRKRICRQVGECDSPDGPAIRIYSTKLETEFVVPVANPTPQRRRVIQDYLQRVVFSQDGDVAKER